VKKETRTVLKRLTEESLREKRHETNIPLKKRMLAITEDTGVLLNIMARSARACSILEVGTSVGYSTIWLAEAASWAGGSVTTIEQNRTKIQRAKKNLAQAGLSNVTILQGDAKNLLSGMQGEFDFVLIDADKENIVLYFDMIAEMLHRGGIITIDNMLYPEKYRTLMNKAALHIRSRSDMRTVTIPIGNGLEVSHKE